MMHRPKAIGSDLHTLEKSVLDVDALLDGELVLDVDSILAIHRHDDGNIAIGKKLPDSTWEWLWMLTPAMLRGTFGAFQEWLIEGGHFSTQAYRSTAPWKGPGALPAIGVDKHNQAGQRRYGRVTENLRWLNCLSCDIDCGRSDQDAKTESQKVPWRDAQRRIEDLQDAGIIPPLSMYGYSGRGLYALWLLHDDRNSDHSAPAYNHDVVTWKALQKELITRVESASLPVDHAGSLITQVYKIGGTIHPKTGRKAQFFITAQQDKNRRLVSYTLSEMAAAIGMLTGGSALPEATRKLAFPAQRRKAPLSRNPLKSNGYKKRHALIASDMLTILAHRLQDGSGGWQKRNQAYSDTHRSPKYGRRLILTLYAQCLVRSTYSPRELLPPLAIDPGTRLDFLSRLREMAARCNPPWPDDQGDGGDQAFDMILDAILREYKPGSDGKQRLPPTPASRTLCAAFGISADLARELDLKSIRPRDVAIESDQARPLQADVIQARRDWLRDYILAHPNPGGGGRWTARKVRDALTPFSLYPWKNHETANQDLNAIGYEMQRSRGGRRRKAVQTSGGAMRIPPWLKS